MTEGPVSAELAAVVGFRLADKVHELRQRFSNRYRPELHYMRGPGPKWHEKHGQRPQLPQIGGAGLPTLGKAGA